jgi:hypothetical protein
MGAIVTAVGRSHERTLVKTNRKSIILSAGLGVDGDAHRGATVRRRSRVGRNRPRRICAKSISSPAS